LRKLANGILLIAYLQAAMTQKVPSLLLAICLIPFNRTTAQNSSQILLDLQKLNKLGSVLYIAAHPDDENTRLLSYLASEKHLRAGYLSLTRGDGGQNLVGKEQGELLGVVRTQELLAARRTDGAEQFFTTANDFGFSKNPDETLKIWNKDSILSDIVLIIRRFKPDVIICRFPTTGEGGHGHHTASALLAAEAFTAAGDPKRFPEQLNTLQTWQTKRICWNTFNFGGTNTTSPDQLKVDVGSFNPLLGKSYGEIASESRSMHKSQGFGSPRQRGSSIEYFKFLNGDSARTDLFDGIDQSWTRISNGGTIQKMIEKCILSFDALSPEKSVGPLIEIYQQINKISEDNGVNRYWKKIKLAETEQLLLGCAGLWLEANVPEYSTVAGAPLNITAQVVKRNNSIAKFEKIVFPFSDDTIINSVLKTNELLSFRHWSTVQDKIDYSDPYWLKIKGDGSRYIVPNNILRGRPENPPALTVIFHIDIENLPLRIEKPVVYKFTDPVKGEIYRSFEVLPPVTINLSENLYAFTGEGQKEIFVTVKANSSNIKGILNLKTSRGFTVKIDSPAFELKNKGDETVITAILNAEKNATAGLVDANAEIKGRSFDRSIRRVEYDHIPYQFVLPKAESELVNIQLKKSGNNIAYIAGAGDEVANCLKQIGYHVTMLNEEMLKREDLSKYSAIVTGVRAFNTNNWLQIYYDKLMKYVSDGGNLVVQYNTNSRVGPMQGKIGPYPFNISRERTTDEKADVSFSAPKHRALSFPNEISGRDFEGWVQERGIYYATDTDPHFEKPLLMHDPGEKDQAGSLIIARYGSGNFVYTGLSFFRQLPAGVPGAFKLFVNLISLPKNN
jgi:LmbE family N-acetylglucosaminyl deacetylase